jgi:hypothetical protein
MTRRGGVTTSAEGDVTPGRERGGDNISWADMNLYRPNLSNYKGILTLHSKLKKNITDNMKHREMLHK